MGIGLSLGAAGHHQSVYRLHLPAQFKFTRGSWNSEAIISNADAGNQIIHDAEHATRVYRLWERNQWMGE